MQKFISAGLVSLLSLSVVFSLGCAEGSNDSSKDPSLRQQLTRTQLSFKFTEANTLSDWNQDRYSNKQLLGFLRLLVKHDSKIDRHIGNLGRRLNSDSVPESRKSELRFEQQRWSGSSEDLWDQIQVIQGILVQRQSYKNPFPADLNQYWQQSRAKIEAAERNLLIEFGLYSLGSSFRQENSRKVEALLTSCEVSFCPMNDIVRALADVAYDGAYVLFLEKKLNLFDRATRQTLRLKVKNAERLLKLIEEKGLGKYEIPGRFRYGAYWKN